MATATLSQLSAATSISSTDLMAVEVGGELQSAAVSRVGIPVGALIPYAGAIAPDGWLVCNGDAVSRSTYSGLFTAIGETWGIGDGSTTFNVPDMRETAPVGIGTCGSLITSTGSAISAHDTYTLGQFKDDQGQGHHHNIFANIGSSGGSGLPQSTYSTTSADIGEYGWNVRGAITDGINGTPRTGTVTHGKRAGVNYIIKY